MADVLKLDLYDILGVSIDATEKQVNDAIMTVNYITIHRDLTPSKLPTRC